MNPKNKKAIKEWSELIAMTVIGGAMVFYVNGFFGSKSDNDTTQKSVQPTTTKNVNCKDTVVQKMMRDTIQMKR